jgi:hypothetical protein
LLRAREKTFESSAEAGGLGKGGEDSRRRGKRREQKVVIHSSPFLRCLQTSVALGAGIAQSEEGVQKQRRRRRSSAKSQNKQAGANTGHQENGAARDEEEDINHITVKPTLRVDAFLGEWLSPEYFEYITPPPDSTMMVATAKAQLLRREQIQIFQPSTAGNGYFPGGWSLKMALRTATEPGGSAVAEDDEPSSRLSSQHTQPHRANSYSSTGNTATKAGHWDTISSTLPSSKTRYNPPIPAYAIAPSDPIPRGYCTHAREECMDVDIHWDSMRQPQDWGDGGELGEEWSSMHKRFRFGLSRMISWYKEHSPDFHPEREDPLALEPDDQIESSEDDYDLVLILVTHGAGCNALVGALTNHPVLMDFGLSSLSMAVQKDVGHDYTLASNQYVPSRRRSSVDFGISEEYDVKIVGSTGHLRAGVEATKAAALQSPHLVPQIPEFRVSEHLSTLERTSPTSNGKKYGALTKASNSMSAALGSIRRGSSASSNTYRNSSRSPTRSSRSGSSSGLWSKPPTTASSIDDGMQELAIGPPADARPESSDSDTPLPTSFGRFSGRRIDEVAPLSYGLGRSMSQHGLWGPKPSIGGHRAELGPKRRWTMSQPDDED